jgi:hypothetical protein
MTSSLSQRFEKIRRYYSALFAELERADLWAGGDPYSWESMDSGITLTPIEQSLMHDIRHVGAVLYPQVPVGRYFVDFGNPLARVAIECDGRIWHRDKDRDEARQRDIESKGWTVYRIGGRDCLSTCDEHEDEAGRWIVRPGYSEEFIRDIAERHRIRFGCRHADLKTEGSLGVDFV